MNLPSVSGLHAVAMQCCSAAVSSVRPSPTAWQGGFVASHDEVGGCCGAGAKKSGYLFQPMKNSISGRNQDLSHVSGQEGICRHRSRYSPRSSRTVRLLELATTVAPGPQRVAIATGRSNAAILLAQPRLLPALLPCNHY